MALAGRRTVLASVAAAFVVTVSACQSSRDYVAMDLQSRSRELTRHLFAGAFDSLPRSAVLDLGGTGDTVLARWFVGRRRASLGREWPAAPLLTLEGLEAGSSFLERLEAAYGRELEVVDEATYPCYQPICELPQSIEYNRIVRFSGYADNTLTIAWLWAMDSLVGGWVIPSRRVASSEFAVYQTKTTLRLPFDREWVVLWGGPKPHENYHVERPPLRFAYDFIVDSAGSLHRTDGRTNADYYCYGNPILAPAGGHVAMVLDSFSENVPGVSRRAYRGPGNFVSIDHGSGEYSILAHLRRGSVRVAAGQPIQPGDTVGECGNNGESLFPHLHYQAQLSSVPGTRPIPAPFADYRVDGAHVARGSPTRGQRVMHQPRR
jgi:murein DD-endopeptidase MepM/ murein hydrolase activator NlpD